MREGCPRQHKVDRGESHIQIVIELGETRIEHIAYLLALERPGCRIDCKLSHDLGYVEGSLLAFEGLVALDEVLHFGSNQGNVRAEGFLGKTKLDEL
jgi:hypothetical protein